ncbi:TOMM precursor leader peptide-binding protein [Streptomyces sodiiphilus]|uniref:TOMM leader peptide-binding protein n=1 Tax=Streptomyces sodiiphilus TaxID=226217 RepID=A0ABN2NV43_9ACTN
MLFGPLDSGTESFLSLLDGTRGLPVLREAAARLGLGAGAADRLAGQLAAAGVLEDATADRRAAAQVTERLRPDLASLSLLHPEPGGGLRRLVARRRAWVQVRGAGRVGAALAATLAQAGVGRVEVVDGGRVEPEDTAPGAIPAERTGQRRDAAACAVVRSARAWPRRSCTERQGGARLVIFAPRDGLAAYAPDPAVAEPVLAAGLPHLYTGVVEGTGFVGPLVLPGSTGCAGCLLRTRAAREPGWPLLVGQWRNARSRGVPACDAALATAVAGLAAASALAHLDGVRADGEGTRAELVLPRLTLTRERIAPHPECPCGAARAAGAAAHPRPADPEESAQEPRQTGPESPQ